jgi:lipopolysaccharide transport system permease protein
MNTDKQNAYEIVIQPNRSCFSIDWKGLWHYRDLLFILVRRDFVSRYKQTILGPIWFVIQPLITTIVFTLIFNKVVNISTDNLPPFLFYLCGLMIWSYFASSLERISNFLVSNAPLFEKVYFPRLIVPLSNLIFNLFTFIVHMMTFLGFYIYFKYFTQAGIAIKPNIFIIAVPLLILQTAAIALGVGLWVAVLTAKYRDISFLMSFIIQIWMFASPIIYPLSTIPIRYRFILAINPMTPILDLFRYAFFSTKAVSFTYLIISLVVTIIILFSGIVIFNKVEKTSIDTI